MVRVHAGPQERETAKEAETRVLGGIAQLARAPALQAGGHRFESVYLHNKIKKE